MPDRSDECAFAISGCHHWERDPDRRGEGLICALCGVTEAELAGWMDDDD